MMQHTPLILTPQDWNEYCLLDSGHGRKLEKFGKYRFIRPESQALWQPALKAESWQADGEFITSAAQNDDVGGKWSLSQSLPESWVMRYDDMSFHAMPTSFRHLGFFPEQSSHWQWCRKKIKTFFAAHHRPPQILNLFGYTGLASLHAAASGAKVVHVDSSKKAIAGAFANRELAQLDTAPIRFITEDARSFVKREARRGRHYDGVILDPPKYGRGAKGEIWQMSDDIENLLSDIRAILAPDACFAILTSYAIRSSFLSLHYALAAAFDGMGGVIESGELAIEETGDRRFKIGQAIFARWQNDGA